MSRRKIALLCAAAALTLLAAAALIWRETLFLPAWAEWRSAQLACGADGAPERIELSGGRVRVYSGGEPVWETEKHIRVQDVLWGDIDHDGEGELMLLCWRRGRYGKHRPFWVEKDEKSWSQHIYLYDWTENGIRPIWMASDIGLDAAAWRFDEQERLVITERSGAVSRWDWLSWGLERIG